MAEKAALAIAKIWNIWYIIRQPYQHAFFTVLPSFVRQSIRDKLRDSDLVQIMLRIGPN